MNCGSGTIDAKRGDDLLLTVNFTDEAGDAIDIIGSTVFFTVKKNMSDEEGEAAIALSQTSHLDAVNGVTTFNVDTSPLVLGKYYYDLRIKTSAGFISTSSRGIFNYNNTVAGDIS